MASHRVNRVSRVVPLLTLLTLCETKKRNERTPPPAQWRGSWHQGTGGLRQLAAVAAVGLGLVQRAVRGADQVRDALRVVGVARHAKAGRQRARHLGVG